MKYRLKDRELQNRLDVLSDGSFSRCLDAAGGSLKENPLSFCFGKNHEKTNMPMFGVWLCKDDVEEEPEYDPEAWNNFPQVTPPVGVWMRCEYGGYRFCAKFVGYKWTDSKNEDMPVHRFRPWDD